MPSSVNVWKRLVDSIVYAIVGPLPGTAADCMGALVGRRHDGAQSVIGPRPVVDGAWRSKVTLLSQEMEEPWVVHWSAF